MALGQTFSFVILTVEHKNITKEICLIPILEWLLHKIIGVLTIWPKKLTLFHLGGSKLLICHYPPRPKTKTKPRNDHPVFQQFNFKNLRLFLRPRNSTTTNSHGSIVKQDDHIPNLASNIFETIIVLISLIYTYIGL